MTNITLPAVGTKVRALYIPSITDTINDDGATGQIVEVTEVRESQPHNDRSGEWTSGPVAYAKFERSTGYTQLFYMSEWEVVTDDESPVPAPEQTETDLLRQRLTDLQQQYDRQRNEAMNTLTIISDRLIAEANNRGWCNEYDEIVERINNDLPNWLQLAEREGEYEVTWTETYTVTIDRTATVTARDADSAADLVSSDPDAFGDSYDIEQAFRTAWQYGNYTHESSDDFCAEQV